MIYIFLTDGFEETEALTTVDILKRAELPVQMVGVNGIYVTSTHDIVVRADVTLDELWNQYRDLSHAQALILPGGAGSVSLKDDERVRHYFTGFRGLIAAICAAPYVLSEYGLLADKVVTSFPSVEDKIKCKQYTGSKVEICENVITSRAAGTTADFAYAIVSHILGDEKAEEIKNKFNGL